MSVYTAVLDRINVAARRDLRVPITPSSSVLTWGMVGADLLAVATPVTVVTAISQTPLYGLIAGLIAAAVMTATTGLRGGYRTGHWSPAHQDLRALLAGVGVATMLAVLLAYLGLVEIPPELLVTALAASVAMIGLLRGAHRLAVGSLRRRGRLVRRVIVIGSTSGFAAVQQVMDRCERDGVQVLGRCAPNNEAQDEQVLGAVQDAPGLVRQLAADTVLVTADALDAEQLRQLSWRLEPLGVTLLIVPDVTDAAAHRTELVSVDGTPMVRIGLGPTRSTRIAKSVIDRGLGLVLSLVALIALVPAMTMVKLTSPGPVFFRQVRVGEDGVPFTMLKLRTMYRDAEERLDQLLEQSDGNGVLFKMKRDPRVTPVGRVLRRFSIDELPQLWHVLRGQMSLVGPRPPLPVEVAEYDDRAYHRLMAKPGLTGLWQVSGRSDLDWEETVRLDLHYVDNRSVSSDLRILARTAGAILGGRGAY